MKYSIDTSAILDGWNRYYPHDVFPALWQNLARMVDQGHLRATEEVLAELERKQDEVYAWGVSLLEMFVEIDERIQDSVREIMTRFPKLVDTRKNRSGADPWIIALAQVHQCAVITGEPETGKAERPNIPDVCRQLEIPCFTLLDLMRRERWKF